MSGALHGPGAAAETAFPVVGNAPLLLDDPCACYRVTAGEAQIFLVEVLEDGRPGTRQHLFDAARGDLLFGLDTALSLPPVKFLAIGSPGTEVVALSRATVAADTQMATGIDTWIIRLSRAISRQIVPRPRFDLPLGSGETTTLPRGGKITSAQGVAWCRASGGLYVDMELTEAHAPVPVTPDSWISLDPDGTIAAQETVDLMAAGDLLPALDRFHALAVDVLPMALRLASVDELNRLRERAAQDRRSAGGALEVLGSVLGQGRRRSEPPPSDQPLVLALAHLGSVAGFEVRLPARRDHEPRPFELDALARASRLRLRHVRLEAGWWRHDSGAFLLMRAAPLPPLAVVPARGGYEVFDPEERTVRRLPAAEAAALSGDAYMLYPALPDRPVSLRQVAARIVSARVRDLAALAGATLLAGVLAMAVPLAISYLVSSVIPDNNAGKIAQVAAALSVLAVMNFVLRLASQLVVLRIEGLEGSRLQAGVMDRMLRLPTGFFRSFTAGDMGTRVMAVARLEKALTASLVGSVMTGMMALISYGVMLAYSWRLALVAILLTLLLAAGTLVLGLIRIRYEAQAIREDARMSGLTLELAAGITKLRLAAAEDRAFYRWARLYAAASRSQLDADRAASLLNTLSEGYPAFAMAVLFAACIYGGLVDSIGLGLLVGFAIAFSSALEGLRGLAQAAVEVVALAPIVAHAAPILHATPEVDGEKMDPGELSGAIEISRLTFQYQPDAPRIFDDLSITIRPGEFVAFVGPSGTGKSTLFRLLLGFEQPASGVVLYDGVDLAGLDIQAVRRQCGVVLQGGKLMPGTLMDNILGSASHLGPDAAWEAARHVALEEDIRRMPMGLHTVITDGGTGLSGGQIQRVLLARAIVSKPRIMMLDEATSALDNRTQAAVTESFNRIAGTRLVIAHRLSTIARADRIIVLNNGRVEEEGSYDALMARNGFFTAFAQRQLTD